MESITYYSRNGKRPPFEVTIEIEGQVVYINCNCPLGLEKKICRHKINAIRGDKKNRHQSTPDEVITRLRRLFGPNSTLRQYLEDEWRLLREFASAKPDNEDEIGNRRRMLGKAFAHGFLNENATQNREPFDAEEWEEARDTCVEGLKCLVNLMYLGHEGIATTRTVLVEEVFVSNSQFYISGYCHLRREERTFRVDRIQAIDFGQECTKDERSVLLDVILKGNPMVRA